MSHALSFSIRPNGIVCEGRLHFPVETSEQDRRRLYDETVRVTGQAHRVSGATFVPGLVDEGPPLPPAFVVTDEERETVEHLRAGTLVTVDPAVKAAEVPSKPAKEPKAKAPAKPKAAKKPAKPKPSAKSKAPTRKSGKPSGKKQRELNI